MSVGQQASEKAIAFVVAVVITGLLAHCGQPGDERQDAGIVVRVSATGGLDEFLPGVGQGGATAAAMDLVYGDTSPHATTQRVSPVVVRYHLSPDSPLSPAEFAQVFQCRGVVSKEADAKSGSVVVTFAESDQASFAESEECGLELGPFRLDSASADLIRLVAVEPTGIQAVELVPLSQNEEWRRLLSRDIQVIPRASGRARTEFERLHTIRTIEMPGRYPVGLHFNVSRPAVTDVAVRHRIASLIDHRAISQVVCGSDRCVPEPEPLQLESGALLPKELTLLVLDNESGMVSAAQVLRHQFRKVGVSLTVRSVSLGAAMEIFGERDYDLAVYPSPRGERRYAFFRSNEDLNRPGFMGYGTPEFDAAFDRNDVAAMDAILARDLPSVVLYEGTYFVALDASLCGDVTPLFTSWSWIADLKACE